MSNKLLKQGKKLLTVGVTLCTIVWSIGLLAVPVSFAAMSGDLIKITCTGSNGSVCSAVYYLGANGKRYVFPNEKTYKTWYSDFSGVKSISQTEMESYPIGGNVTYRPGVKMIKIQTDPKVYAVDKNGSLRWVNSEAVAKALYGDMWNKQIDDVSDAFFVNYTVGTEISSASQYDKTAVWTASSSINVDKGLSGGPSVGGSTLTIALSADTPASGLVFGSASRVPFTTFTLTASSDGDVVVDSLTIERSSAAQDAAFSDFDILDASTMLPVNNLSKSLNSLHQAVFSDDITVKAGTTMKLIIAANMASGALSSYAGEVPVLGVAAVALKGGATLVGTLPVNGNYQNVNGTLTVGTATITVGSNNPAAATKEVGTKGYIVSSVKITNGSSSTGQDFKLKSITFTQNGSASPEDLTNLKLINVNTSQTIATVATISDKKVRFNNLDVSIKKGDNFNFDLRLDINSGSSRTISMDIDQRSDIVLYDMLRGFNVLPSYTNSAGTAVSASPYYNANNTTIGDGKLRIESLTISQDKIAENSKKVTLGKFKFVVEGEPVNITALGFVVTTGGTAGQGAITNIALVDKNGNTVGGPQDPTPLVGSAAQATATTTDTITVPVGENIYTVVGDLNSDFTANDTVQIGIFPAVITVKGDVSGNTITPTPTGQVQSTSLTVKTAALAVSLGSTPSAQTVVAGTQDFEFAQIVLNASDSGSDIRVTQISVVVTSTNVAANLVSGIEVYDGSTKLTIDSSSQSCSETTCSTSGNSVIATTTLTITSGNLTVPRATSKTLRIVGDIGTGDTSGTFQLNLQGGNITGIDQEAQSITPTYTTGTGGIMTLAAGGTLNISFLSDPKAGLVIGGSTVEVGKFILDAKNEALTLNKLGFEVNNPDGGDVGGEAEIASIELWESGGSAPLGTVEVNSSRATITPSVAVTLAQNTSKTFILKTKWENLQPASSGSPATSGEGARMRLTYVDVKGTSAASSSISINPSGIDGATGNFASFHVFKSMPTVTVTTFSGDDKIVANSAHDLFKFNVKADAAGPISVVKFTFGVATSTVILNPSGYKLYESTSASDKGTVITDTGDFQLLGFTDNAAAAGTLQVNARFDTTNDSGAVNAADLGDHLVISAGTTRYFTLEATIASGHDNSAQDESIAVEFAGDDAFAGTALLNVASIDGSIEDDDFIWSDLNFDQYATTTATYTIGWFNGYRVPGMSDNSSTRQTITN